MSAGVTVSGLVSEFTGIGVVQRALYPRLANLGLRVTLSQPREPSGPGVAPRLRALALALGARPDPGDIYFSTVNPFPLRPGPAAVTLVHDLQWLETKRGLDRTYHRIDLARTLRRSHSLIAISERVRTDILTRYPQASGRVHVCPLGPGIVEESEFHPRARRDVLLMGGATHKENEVAAEMLRHAQDDFDMVIGIGVSDRVRRICEEALGQSRCEWYSHISQEEVLEKMRQAYFFVLLGQAEGFGLPYVEALSMGAHVVAIDQPLTREILGPAGILLQSSPPRDLALQLRTALRALPPETVRRNTAEKYNWDLCARQMADVLKNALAEKVDG